MIKGQYYQDNKPIVTLSHQSEIQYLIFFYLMPIGVPRVPFRSPGEEDALWIDVQCDLSDILGHMVFPRSLPRSRYPPFRPRKIDSIIKNLEREVQLDLFFFGRVYRLILSIRIIYGWLGQANKMKYPGSVQKKKPMGNKYIYDYYLYHILFLYKQK